MTPHPEWVEHPAEDTLEEYAFNRLAEEEAAPLEEHLLVCSICQDRLAASDEYIRLMKAAADQLQKDASRKPAGEVLARGFGWAGFAAACCLAAVSWVNPRGPAKAPAQIELFAFRGSTEMAHAPAGHPLNVAIDISDLAPPAGYRVQVVDAWGREEWNGQASASGMTLKVAVPKTLARGVHWVRLSSSNGELLREFGLRID
ncbi:MAG TPA: hypothetical protein VKX39_19105 [Bryobacteraceae bacterium]|nr:hypothetical protein [Bryobacteraceae bacterium]